MQLNECKDLYHFVVSSSWCENHANVWFLEEKKILLKAGGMTNSEDVEVNGLNAVFITFFDVFIHNEESSLKKKIRQLVKTQSSDI